MHSITEQLKERYGKDYLSYSSIKFALSDMAQFDRYMRGEMYKDSEAFAFGSLYDMMLFEHDKCMETYVLITDAMVMDRVSEKTRALKKPKMSAEYKQVLQQIKEDAEAEGKIITSIEDWNTAKEMIERIDNCGLRKYLTGSVQERISVDYKGVRFVGYIDCHGDNFVTDLKSTRSVMGFRYDIKKFSYHLQAFLYMHATGADQFYWVAQEKTFPYLPALVECSEDTLWSAELTINDSIAKIQRFLDNDVNFNTDYVQYTV